MTSELRERLTYDPDTGDFTWRISGRGFKKGGRPGSFNADGYHVLNVAGKKYLAHRVAFYLMLGKFPKYEIDHRDLNPSNNKWDNLREAKEGWQNKANCHCRSRSESGLKGVKPYRKGGYQYWRAVITKNKKQHCLGYFKDKNEAHAAYCVAAKQMFGEFARAI